MARGAEHARLRVQLDIDVDFIAGRDARARAHFGRHWQQETTAHNGDRAAARKAPNSDADRESFGRPEARHHVLGHLHAGGSLAAQLDQCP